MPLPYAAGMLYSTVRDLHRWKRALHGGHVFKDPTTLGRMLTPSGDGPYGYAHGLGVGRKALGPDTVLSIGHGGHIEGFNSDDGYFPERGSTVVVLDNMNGDVGAVADDLVRLLLGQAVETPRRPISHVVADAVAAEGVEAAVARYRALREGDPDGYDFAEDLLNVLGYTYLIARRRRDGPPAPRVER